MAYPTDYIDLADASDSEVLSTMHEGLGHAEGTNKLRDELLATQTKLGLGATIPVASLTPRTRSLWLSAHVFSGGSVAPTLSGLVWVFSPSVDQDVLTSFQVPADWASGTIAVKLYWSGSTDGEGGNTIKVSVGSSLLGAGDLITAVTTSPGTGASAQSITPPTVLNQTQITTATGTIAGTAAAGKISAVRVTRYGSTGTDTYTGSWYLLGVMLEYTADS